MPDPLPSFVLLTVLATGAVLAGVARLVLPLSRRDVGFSFEAIDGKDVCRVDVAPADRPVFLGSAGGARTADFHLRVGNATRRLLTDEVLEYQARRWPQGLARG